MSLRNQPYIPLYIQDIMTDEKLNECCAATHGIYIKGIMCLMHKSETYGKILLKQKYKQTKSIYKNFAEQLSRQLPYSIDEVKKALIELINENVCYFENDYLCQRRMIKDNDISLKRSNAGKKGGGNSSFVKTKIQTNSEDENENENENVNNNKSDEEIFISKSCNIFSRESLIENLKNEAYLAQILENGIKVSLDEKNALIDRFCAEKALELNRSYSEITKHFLNWAKKQKKKIKENIVYPCEINLNK